MKQKTSLIGLMLYGHWALAGATQHINPITSDIALPIAQQKAAVGYYRTTGNNISPLTYTSTNEGATWVLRNPLPLPGDVAATGIQMSELHSIRCDSTELFCCAVGFYRKQNNNLAPLSYTSTNGGTSWFLSNPLPLPSNVAANGIQVSKLQSVACDNTGHRCTVVGFYLNNSNNLTPLSYSSTNGGASWSLSNPLPLPADVATNGIQNSKLQGVNCDATGTHCGAIGFYLTNGNNIVPLSYTTVNSGITWSLSTGFLSPTDVAATGSQTNALFGLD